MFKRKTYREDDLLANMLSGGRMEDQTITYLLKEHGPKVMHFVKTHGGSTEDGEDILQEGIAQLVMNVRKGRFKSGSKIFVRIRRACLLNTFWIEVV